MARERGGNKRFARWLVAARRAAQLTQEQLAERLDVTQPTIGYWEHVGKEKMAPSEVRDLMTYLHVDAVEVLDALGYPTRGIATNGASPVRRLDETDAEQVADEIARLYGILGRLGAQRRGRQPEDLPDAPARPQSVSGKG